MIQGAVKGFQKSIWTHLVSQLKSVAKEQGLTAVWDSLVQPWLDQEDTLRALGKGSAGLQLPRVAGNRNTGEPAEESSELSDHDVDACQDQAPDEAPRTAQDELMFDYPEGCSRCFFSSRGRSTDGPACRYSTYGENSGRHFRSCQEP